MNVKKCDRCLNDTQGITTMSMFNEDIICMDCKEKEKKRPDYQKAVDADIEQIKKGNYNFKGIGMSEKGSMATGGEVGKSQRDIIEQAIIILGDNSDIVDDGDLYSASDISHSLNGMLESNRLDKNVIEQAIIVLGDNPDAKDDGDMYNAKEVAENLSQAFEHWFGPYPFYETGGKIDSGGKGSEWAFWAGLLGWGVLSYIGVNKK